MTGVLVRFLALTLFAGLAVKATAAEYKKLVLSDGTAVEYALVLPTDFRPGKAYPAILAFPGGRQPIKGVGESLERFWEAEAAKRGFIVVAPAAPAVKPFFQAGADLIPEFLRHFLGAYRIKDGKFHVAGHSNGAVSAFRVAIHNPEMFRSVIALAGFPESQEDFDRLERLRGIDVTMFVGDGDLYWKEGMEKTKDKLESLGMSVYFEIIPRNGHFFPDLRHENSWKIFDHIGE